MNVDAELRSLETPLRHTGHDASEDLFDLAADVHPARIERLIDSVLSRSPCVLTSFAGFADDLGIGGPPRDRRHARSAGQSV